MREKSGLVETLPDLPDQWLQPCTKTLSARGIKGICMGKTVLEWDIFFFLCLVHLYRYPGTICILASQGQPAFFGPTLLAIVAVL